MKKKIKLEVKGDKVENKVLVSILFFKKMVGNESVFSLPLIQLLNIHAVLVLFYILFKSSKLIGVFVYWKVKAE